MMAIVVLVRDMPDLARDGFANPAPPAEAKQSWILLGARHGS
jgi:hypothetical protein